MNTTVALGAEQAARIAKGVYSVQRATTWDEIKSRGQTGIDQSLKITGQFSMGSKNRFSGSSGGNLYRSDSGFGYIADGVGDRKHEVLIGIRGTTIAADWATDFLQALYPGPSGSAAHGGFVRTFQSFEPTLHNYLHQSQRNPTTIHIVGHSLGGALATIAADYVAARGLDVKLYTFGSPRVGTNHFSEQLSNNVTSANMFRVSNQSDPVTMVPVFPFIHVPNNSAQYLIPSWGGVNPFNHFMDRYIDGCLQKDWANLKAPTEATWSEQAMAWLDLASASGGAVQMNSAKTLWMIMKCLNLILRGVARTGGVIVLGVVTVVDRLSMVLHQGALESPSVEVAATKLIAVILKVLGRDVPTGIKLTVTFIRWVLDLLFRALSMMAGQALRSANT